jgi:putative membrane protein
MDSAVKHYSSLFFLPSFRKTLATLTAVCIGVLGLSTTVLLPSFEGLVYGISLGISSFALTLLSDYITATLVLRNDAIFVMRRTSALSTVCWLLWLAFILPGAAFGFWLWVKLCLLGFSAVMTLRAVVFFSTSTARLTRGVLNSLLQPFLCIIPFLVYWTTLNQASFLQVLPFLMVSPFVSLASANLLVSLVDRLGRESYGVPAMSLFRAFMLNWVEGLNAPIEKYFEKLGEDEDIEVSLLEFETVETKTAVIVPLVHPGPFKNIGSSLLPSLLKHEFERKFGGTACVPLGMLGHELDLASQTQNQRVMDHVMSSAGQVPLSYEAKPFVKVTNGFVTVSCQVFGDEVLLSFSLAPKTTEDLPQELGRFVQEEARKRGLEGAIVVNAHNSITDETEIEAPLDMLKATALRCLDEALALPSADFQVGAATVYPKDFSLKDGMGPGGITAVAVRVAGQKTAYVVIDGNNMVSGLREKILSALASVGFDESEVFTTDTHAVNAVVLERRGYHPVGESMDHETLLSYVKEAALAAVSRLESCKSGALTVTVPKVKVIGQARIHALSTLVDKALQRAKRVAVPIFALEGLLLILLLVVL